MRDSLTLSIISSSYDLIGAATPPAPYFFPRVLCFSSSLNSRFIQKGFHLPTKMKVVYVKFCKLVWRMGL